MESMQLNIQPGQSVTLQCQGSGIWFETGASSTSDAYMFSPTVCWCKL